LVVLGYASIIPDVDSFAKENDICYPLQVYAGFSAPNFWTFARRLKTLSGLLITLVSAN
jgi:hypothetical protein